MRVKAVIASPSTKTAIGIPATTSWLVTLVKVKVPTPLSVEVLKTPGVLVPTTNLRFFAAVMAVRPSSEKSVPDTETLKLLVQHGEFVAMVSSPLYRRVAPPQASESFIFI